MEVTPNRGFIQTEINKITKFDNPFKNNMEYKAIIHTPKDTIEIEYLESIDTMRNYNSNIADYVNIRFKMILGTYAKRVYEYRDNLVCSITKSFKDKYMDPNTITYKMVIISDGGGMETSQNVKKLSEDEMNKSGVVTIEAQLYLREVEALRSIYVDGVYKRITLKELMQGIFALSKNKATIDGQDMDYRIDVIEPSNQIEYQNLVLPTGLTLAALPSYLQGTDYGVYNGGIGTYIQNYKGNNCIFIYPIYSTERYEKNEDKNILTIINTNTTLYDVVENNWCITGNNISLLAGSKTSSDDPGTNALINGGDALIMSPPEGLFRKNYELTDEGIAFDEDEQLRGTTIKNRRDGIVRARYVGNESNMYKQRTQSIIATMATYKIPWNFSNIDIIYPGMPCCYMFEDANLGLVKLFGTVQAAYSRYNKQYGTESGIVVIKVKSHNITKI